MITPQQLPLCLALTVLPAGVSNRGLQAAACSITGNMQSVAVLCAWQHRQPMQTQPRTSMCAVMLCDDHRVLHSQRTGNGILKQILASPWQTRPLGHADVLGFRRRWHSNSVVVRCSCVLASEPCLGTCAVPATILAWIVATKSQMQGMAPSTHLEQATRTEGNSRGACEGWPHMQPSMKDQTVLDKTRRTVMPATCSFGFQAQQLPSKFELGVG